MSGNHERVSGEGEGGVYVYNSGNNNSNKM